jgi:SAM-dependent methyltransferase
MKKSDVNNFSFEWKIHQKTQLDSKNNDTSEKNFNIRFGFDKKFWENKKVLDVGCGTGRYAIIPLKYGAYVTGVDLSDSIQVAKKNLKDFDKAELVEADLFSLPFKEESFDVIYSFGVLHHTPDPYSAFKGLLKFLKPGGQICITLYHKSGMYHSSRYLRKITTIINPKLLYPLLAIAVFILYIPYKYLGFRYGILGRIMPISLSSNFFEAILDTFDCYSPKFQFTYDTYEIYNWYKDNNLKNIDIIPQAALKDNNVTLLGTK